MKRLLLLVAAWLAVAGAATASELMWEVRGPDGTVRGHLFGTLHLCNAQCFPLSARVRSALAGSEVLALELDPADVSMGAMLASAGMLEPGMRLDSLVPSELQEALAGAIARSGVDESAIQAMKPWLASSVLMVGAAADAGFAAHWGIDLWLAREARRTGRTLITLETVERQIAALSAGGEGAQVESLAQILRLIQDDGVGDFLERIRLAWQRGDEQALVEMLDEKGDRSILEPLIDDLVNERNAEMARRIAELMRSRERVFVAIGAAHLGGQRGIVAQLAGLGFVLCRPQAVEAVECVEMPAPG